VHTITGIFLGESYNGICVLADLLVTLKIPTTATLDAHCWYDFFSFTSVKFAYDVLVLVIFLQQSSLVVD